MSNQEIGQTIDAQRAVLAEAIVARHYAAQPDLAARFGPAGRAKCLQDTNYHLSYLSQSIAVSTPGLFADYVSWARVMLARRNVPAEDLAANLDHIRDTLEHLLPVEMRDTARQYLDEGVQQIQKDIASPPPFLTPAGPHAELAKHYLDALLAADRHTANTLILDAVGAGVSIRELYLHVFQRSQQELGRLWQLNQVSVAQEHYCTAATQLIMSQLYPHIFTPNKNGRTLVASSVAGDLHELGIRMVADFFEMEGWNTFYLGANTPAADIVKTLVAHRADALALSATITFHIQAVAHVIAEVRSSEICKDVKVVVGGYPFNVAPDLWKKIGADGYAVDALSALSVVNTLLGI